MDKKNTNGNAAQGAATKEIKNQPPVDEKKNDLANAEVKPENRPVKILTVEERRTKKDLFDKLLIKHDTLQDSKKKLDQFIIGSDEHSHSLSLKDAKNVTFSTGNQAVIKEVIELVKKQVTLQCGVVEKDILDFVV